MNVSVSIVEGPVGGIEVDVPDGSGASLEFRGVIRKMEGEDALDGIEYEVAEPEASRKLHTICTEVAGEHGIAAVTLIHSSGFVPVGDASLLVVVQSPHRAQALTAMGEIIDRLKATVPIWKHPRAVGDAERLAVREHTPARDVTTPRQAIDALHDAVKTVEAERVPLAEAAGRVLAEPLTADRDSPPVSVSSMDGFAIASADARSGRPLPLHSESLIGSAPPGHQIGSATRIVTGAPVPDGADAVVPVEQASQLSGAVAIAPGFIERVRPGLFIRRAGENAAGGTEILPPGQRLHAAAIAGLAHFGNAEPLVHRRIRVGVIVTGNELEDPSSTPEPWRIRDSNGPALQAALSSDPCFTVDRRPGASDDRDAITKALSSALEANDAVILTGGVSVGPHDHVSGAVADVGCEVLFHRLRQRPGKPMLGAIAPGGRPVFGLPGNPVSVLATTTTIVLPVLRRMAGLRDESSRASVTLSTPDDRHLELWWHRMVNRSGDDVWLVPERGSGDLVAAARSAGLVQIPPRGVGHGPWPYHPWPGGVHV